MPETSDLVGIILVVGPAVAIGLATALILWLRSMGRHRPKGP